MIIYIIYIYIYLYMFAISPFTVAHVYMLLELTIWDWITSLGFLWRKLILLPSASIDRL